VPVPADDDVVVHGDPERLCDLRDLPRHLDIGTRRSRIAGGMVVDQTTLRASALISLVFLLRARQQGTWIGGGKQCLIVMIPLPHFCSRELVFSHGWSINSHPEQVRLASNSLRESGHHRLAASGQSTLMSLVKR
jgi:hypothetical protein